MTDKIYSIMQGIHSFDVPMFEKCFAWLIFILTFLWCSVVFADETEVKTTAASGGNQIIVSPLNIILDLGEM